MDLLIHFPIIYFQNDFLGDDTYEEDFVFTSLSNAIGTSSSCRGINGYVEKAFKWDYL
jgi:hypothetical protein